MATGGPQFPASSWDTNPAAAPATIGRADNTPPTQATQRDLVPVQQLPGQNTQAPQQAASSWDDPWARDPWGQTTQAQTSGQTSQDDRTNPNATRDPAISWQMGSSQPVLVPNQPQNQTPGGSSMNGQATSPQSPQQAPIGVTAEQPPWLPLLLVSLSLMGSLSANLFLGWSYLDARQKYRSLVRKTADTFRRVTNAAA
jgi:hypothetical protein